VLLGIPEMIFSRHGVIFSQEKKIFGKAGMFFSWAKTIFFFQPK